jgi:hypothetical protein
MGYFLAVSAFQDSAVERLAQAIRRCASEFNVACHTFDPERAESNPETDASLFEPVEGWTVVLWPAYFNIHDFPVCQALSEQLSTLVSTMHVYDGDYWAHGLFERGQLLDRFCSQPDYFAEDSETAERMKTEWRGDPETIASRFNVSAEAIRGYVLRLASFEESVPQPRSLFSLFKRRRPGLSVRKVKPDDEFGLDNFWVFTDFWKRLGIRYPDNVAEWAKLVRFDGDFKNHLPHLDEL